MVRQSPGRIRKGEDLSLREAGFSLTPRPFSKMMQGARKLRECRERPVRLGWAVIGVPCELRGLKVCEAATDLPAHLVKRLVNLGSAWLLSSLHAILPEEFADLIEPRAKLNRTTCEQRKREILDQTFELGVSQEKTLTLAPVIFAAPGAVAGFRGCVVQLSVTVQPHHSGPAPLWANAPWHRLVPYQALSLASYHHG